jgi:signal transduction histidine kinase
MNLILNAAEAMGEQGGVVHLRVGTVRADADLLSQTYFDDDLPEGDYITLEVADDGPGIDEQVMTRIFDPFYSTKRDGRGLGLAAVLGIVRRHRGAIRVDAAPGRGTRFVVLLPVSARPARPAAPR